MAQRRDIKSLPPDQDTIIFRFGFKRTKRFERRLQDYDCDSHRSPTTWRLTAALNRFVGQQPQFCGVSDVINEAKDVTDGFDDGYGYVYIDVFCDRDKVFQHTAARIKQALEDFLEAECKARDE